VTGSQRIPRALIAVLGLITIGAYGAWHYSFGVLLDPIIADTGWSESALTAAFSASTLAAGAGSLGGGWLLDRFGSRIVFGLAACVVAVAFSVAASAGSPAVFGPAAAVGGGALGGLGFYHVTQTVAARISPHDATRAIAVLTIWGAFAAAVYLPAAAWLVQAAGWRLTLRALALSAAAALAAGALTIDTRSGEAPRGLALWSELGAALKTAAARRLLIAQGLVGVSVAVMVVYQAPVMRAAGLTLTAASFWAGFRGFAQLGGRVPLMAIVARLGAAGALRLAYSAIAAGLIVLVFAGTAPVAAVFAVVAGFGVGASSPLVGMYSRAVFGSSSLGAAMGLLSLVFFLVGSLGPVAGGWISSAGGPRALPVILGAVTAAAAVPLIRAEPRTSAPPPKSVS